MVPPFGVMNVSTSVALAAVDRVGVVPPPCHCTDAGHTTARPPVASWDWIRVTVHAAVDVGFANAQVTVAAFSVAVCTAPDDAVSVGEAPVFPMALTGWEAWKA